MTDRASGLHDFLVASADGMIGRINWLVIALGSAVSAVTLSGVIQTATLVLVFLQIVLTLMKIRHERGKDDDE